MKTKPAKSRTRSTTTMPSPRLSIAETWRAAFSPASAHRYLDVMDRLAAWRDKLPPARRRKLLAAWDDIRDGLAEVSVAQSIDDAGASVRVAIYGIPPRPSRGIRAATTRRRAA